MIWGIGPVQVTDAALARTRVAPTRSGHFLSGVRRALRTTRSHGLVQFLVEAVSLSLLGGISGRCRHLKYLAIPGMTFSLPALAAIARRSSPPVACRRDSAG